MTRYRRKDAKPGELIAYYGKLPHDNPDICYAWGGDGATKRHGNLLAMMFGGKRVEPVYGQERAGNGGLPYRFTRSFLEELDAAGCDLSTLKFSIRMKTNAHANIDNGEVQ